MGVHDVQVYPEVKRLLGIPEDEPIFILRAKDDLSPEVISEYEECAALAGCNTDFTQGMMQVHRDFSEWRKKNPDACRLPD